MVLPSLYIPENEVVFGMSTHAKDRGRRHVRRCRAGNGSDDMTLSLSGENRHTKVVPVSKHKI